MEVPPLPPASNPLRGLISDEVYRALSARNLLHERAVRDYQMRRTFEALRAEDVPAQKAIDQIRERHAYLQFDTVRKIVYNINAR